MKRICVASLVQQVTGLLLTSALIGCNGKVEDSSTNPTPSPTSTAPSGSSGGEPPTPAPSTPSSDPTSVVPVHQATCATTTAASAIADLPLPANVDAVLEYAMDANDPTYAPVLTVTVGTPCATATDKADCETALAGFLAGKPHPADEEGCFGSAGACVVPSFVVFTAGNTVTKVTTPSDVVDLYGTVTTPAEAALVAQLSSDQVITCQKVTPKADGSFQFPGACRTMSVSPTGIVSSVTTGVCLGRRTDGSEVVPPTSGAGGWLAHMADLEHAAVDAFARMVLELRHHGAPDDLVARAEEARRDEIRHTELMASAARRAGASPSAHHTAAATIRERAAIGLENAVEGCVRETYGAIVAAYQAETARDPELRAALVEIAADEARHAQLSWDLAAWLEPQLDAQTRDAIDVARREALEELVVQATRDAALHANVPGLVDATGLPSPEVARALLEAARPTLMS